VDLLKRQASGGTESLLAHADEAPTLTNAQSDVNVERMWAGHGSAPLPGFGVKSPG